MGEVVKPFGDYATPGVVDEVVERLEELLSQAKRGEITGLSWAIARPNSIVSWGVRRGSAGLTTILAATELLKQHILDECRGETGDGDGTPEKA